MQLHAAISDLRETSEQPVRQNREVVLAFSYPFDALTPQLFMTPRIYHNPRCSKSRQTLALIQEQGIEPEIIEYLQNPPSAEELDSILQALEMEPMQLMRKGEGEFKELDLANSDMTRDELITTMIAHPKLIERPIVVAKKGVVIGRPPENVLAILDK